MHVEVTIKIREDQDRWSTEQWQQFLTGVLRSAKVKPESVQAQRRFI